MSFRSRWVSYTLPFKGASWAFWLLAAAPAVWGAIFPCATHPEYFYLTYPVMAVAASFWEAHARQLLAGSAMDLQTVARLAGRAAVNLLLLFFFSLLLAIPVGILVPSYQCYTDRAKTSELVLAAARLRETIEKNVKASGTLEKSGLNISVQPGGRVSNGFVTDNGSIILISDNPPAVLTMIPSLKVPGSGGIEWKCRGYPEKIFPMMCRAENQK